MKKTVILFILVSIDIFYISCGRLNQTNPPKDNIRSGTKDTVTSYWPGDTVIQIKKGSNGTILIVSIRGVFRYGTRLPAHAGSDGNGETGQGNSFTNLTSKLGSHRFNDALQDRKGNLWFASDDSGVYHYNARLTNEVGQGESQPTGQAGFQHFTTRDGLANNSVICIYEDKAGMIWFGTARGVSRYDGKSFLNLTMKGEGWFYNFITTFMEDKTGKLWISARGEISIYDARLNDEAGQGKTFTTLPNTGDKVYDVFSIIEDRKGNIWFGGWDGVRRYDGKTFTKFTHSQGYNFIIEDKKGNIWTSGSVKNGSAWALSRYDEKSLNNKNPIVTEIMSGQLRTYSGILEASDGSIWFGNNGGLYRYDARLNDEVGQGKTITDFRRKEGQK